MDPTTGTFLSVDPVVPIVSDPQSLNAYAYARNNPVTHTDPSGMCVIISHCVTIDYGFSPGSSWETTSSYNSSTGSWSHNTTYTSEGVTVANTDAGVAWSSHAGIAPSPSATSGGWSVQGVPSGAMNSASAAHDAGGGWFQGFFRTIGEIARGELGEISGILNTPAGIIRGLYLVGRGFGRIATGRFADGLSDIGLGVANVAASAVMLRSGSASGLLHVQGRSITPGSGTRLDNASVRHDGYRLSQLARDSSLQFGWIRDAWTGPGSELGPWGQAYRIYGTVGFGTIGALQAAAGL